MLVEYSLTAFHLFSTLAFLHYSQHLTRTSILHPISTYKAMRWLLPKSDRFNHYPR
ncbi:hypothetical protein Hanom_Chr15g01388491 [Helianthus anomalus]